MLPADLMDGASPAHLVRVCTSALGMPTLLINNAAMFLGDEIADLDQAQWDAQLAVNLAGPGLPGQGSRCRAAGGRDRKHHKHHRSTRLEADAAILLLHGLQACAMGGHAHPGTGAGAAHPRQRHRAGAGLEKHAPDRGGVSGAMQSHHPRTRHHPAGDRRRHPLHP